MQRFLLVDLLLGVSTKNVLKTQEVIISAKKWKRQPKELLQKETKKFYQSSHNLHICFLRYNN